LKQFNELGLAEPILHAVAAEGYTNPTPIQAQFIPVMLEGRDVLGIAQTGTGKTAAFVLPLLDEIANHGGTPAPKSCKALILAPTRELAAQIADSVRTYGRSVKHSVAVIVGGAKPGPQVRALAHGVDIIVATPGRLLDHMTTGAVRLDRTTTVVLDEADQMLDLGFMPAIRRIMKAVPDARQTVLLSATMPKQIRALANDFLKTPAEIAVTPASRPIERIEQKVLLVDKSAKTRLLIGVLTEFGAERAIVFTRTKHGADKVSRNLERAGLSAAAIHGNKSQNNRERTLAAFRNGGLNILVATDIAARGIDIDDVSHVVNYELPNVPEVYVHRIGRTARAGKSGVAVSFCDETERSLLRDIERLIGSSLHTARADMASMPEIRLAPARAPQQRERQPEEKKAGAPGRSRRRRRKPSNGNAPHANRSGERSGKPGPARTRGKPAGKRRREAQAAT